MSATVAETLVIENRLSELSRVEEWLADILDAWDVPPRALFAVDLVINEAVTNVISYGFKDTASHEISISLSDSCDVVGIEIVDDGEPFDPFAAPPAPAAGDLDSATVGGRGILLIKSFADAYHYKRVAGRNHVSVKVRKAEPDPAGSS
jgi:anti-sigma regulatory factor (Ser/Thr protein kinase)